MYGCNVNLDRGDSEESLCTTRAVARVFVTRELSHPRKQMILPFECARFISIDEGANVFLIWWICR